MNIIHVGYDSTNYYIVEHERKRLLLDCGMPGTLPRFLGVLKRKGIALGDIGYVVATHFHPDHAGLVQDLKNRGVAHLLLAEQRPAVAWLNGYIRARGGSAEIELADSLGVPVAGSRAWLAAHLGLRGAMVLTPGHSDDSVSLVLDEGLAFTGDLPPAQPSDEASSRAVRESWDTLRLLGVVRVYPGHGPWDLALDESS
ncbi:MAG TPA: MBL fold metallo-hydrolase [Ardenticatenaceae bacterium]|nr:MBL fold metallo-hydrolase [Ardenticatenaceae bacterium]